MASQLRSSGVLSAEPSCLACMALGCSGGPVMNSSGKCVGIAFQALAGDTQSVG